MTINPDALSYTVTEVFKAIAIVFQPQDYSATEEVLAAKADAVAERCTKKHSLLKQLVFDESIHHNTAKLVTYEIGTNVITL